MALIEKVEFEDLIYIDILSNPVLFGEYVNNVDNTEYDTPFEYTDYQTDLLLDFNTFVSMRGARSVGKTVSIRDLFVWAMTFDIFPGEYYIFTTPGRAHLEPVFTAVTRSFRMNSFLKRFIEKSKGINNSDFTIELLSKAKLMCRIAGQTGTGIAVNGLHTPFQVLDESGFYNWNTYLEYTKTLNTWEPGCRSVVAGVPTGLRENNVNYHCDMVNSEFSKHRISAFQNPRYSEKDHQRDVVQYGGEDSDEYARFVKGEHGRPVFALFDRGLMSIGDNPVYKLTLDGTKILENIGSYIERISVLPGLPDKRSKCFFGIDLGYTEPTAIFILYIDDYGRIKFHAKIQLTKVSYPIQEKFINYLDTKYNPLFIGMDEGNAGKSVRQHLLEDIEYSEKRYDKRLIKIDFSSNTVIGMDSEGEEIKSKTKPFATSVLQEYSTQHKIMYSSTDLETITELERMTFTKTPSGEIIYRTLTEKGGKKGEDHFTSALLCGTLAYYLVYEYIQQKDNKRKLAKGGWFRK